MTVKAINNPNVTILRVSKEQVSQRPSYSSQTVSPFTWKVPHFSPQKVSQRRHERRSQRLRAHRRAGLVQQQRSDIKPEMPLAMLLCPLLVHICLLLCTCDRLTSHTNKKKLNICGRLCKWKLSLPRIFRPRESS